MPRVEDNDLETSQRHGLLDEERSISGCKRICYLIGWIEGKTEKWCWLIISLILYSIVIYFIGYYFGSSRYCIYNGSM